MANPISSPRGAIVGGVLCAAGLFLVWDHISPAGGVAAGLAGAWLLARGIGKARPALFALASLPVVALAGYYEVRQREAQQRSLEYQAFVAALAPVCRDKTGVAQAAMYQKDKPGPRRLVGFRQGSGGSWWDEQTPGPEAWRTSNLSEVQLVVCSKMQTEVLESCRYGNESGSKHAIVERQRYSLQVELHEARTARPVQGTTFTGTEPGPCPDTKAIGGGHDRHVTGTLISVDDQRVQDFLRPFIQ